MSILDDSLSLSPSPAILTVRFRPLCGFNLALFPTAVQEFSCPERKRIRPSAHFRCIGEVTQFRWLFWALFAASQLAVFSYCGGWEAPPVKPNLAKRVLAHTPYPNSKLSDRIRL
jgi:hypothetical protein